MSLARKLQREFFDLTSDGVLIYSDPAIGPLCNPQRHLSVKLDAKKTRFELILKGRVEQGFELGPGVAQACRAAFAAYFDTFQRLIQDDTEVAAA